MNSTQEVNRLFKENYPLIKKIAADYYKKYKGNKLDFDDFIQESSIQSLKWLKRYDSTKSKVSVFLNAYVGKELVRYGVSNLFSIDLPRHMAERIPKTIKIYDKNEVVTIPLLQQKLKCSEYTAKTLMTIIEDNINIGLDSLSEEGSYHLLIDKKQYEKINEKLDNKYLIRSLDKMLKSEPERNINIFKQYYLGEGKQTLEKISTQYGVTKQCIDGILKRCLKKIRHKLDIGVKIYE